MIDIHSHLLPGIDDGPATERESVEMARVAWEDGTREIVCTPHLSSRTQATAAEVHEVVDRMRAALMKAKVPLQIHPGREIALDMLPGLSDDELRRSTYGNAGRWLLLEMPHRGWPLNLTTTLEDLSIRGFSVVLAHPERSPAVQRQPDRLREAVGLGALLQLTAGSFLGDHNSAAQRTAKALANLRWMHSIASDGHSPTWRPPKMTEGVAAAAGGLGLTASDLNWMVVDVPRSLLSGQPVRPPRPSSRPGIQEDEPWDSGERGGRSRA